jgi:hypothetical protein
MSCLWTCKINQIILSQPQHYFFLEKTLTVFEYFFYIKKNWSNPQYKVDQWYSKNTITYEGHVDSYHDIFSPLVFFLLLVLYFFSFYLVLYCIYLRLVLISFLCYCMRILRCQTNISSLGWYLILQNKI